MQLRTLKPVSMKEMLAQVRALPLYTHQSAYLWQMCLSVGNQFCDAVVRAGYLSYEQMFSAACRYCIGASKLGGVIFWQIDHEGRRQGDVLSARLSPQQGQVSPSYMGLCLAGQTQRQPQGHLLPLPVRTPSTYLRHHPSAIKHRDSRGREDCLYPERTVSGVYLAGIRRTQRSAAREVPPAAWS